MKKQEKLVQMELPEMPPERKEEKNEELIEVLEASVIGLRQTADCCDKLLVLLRTPHLQLPLGTLATGVVIQSELSATQMQCLSMSVLLRRLILRYKSLSTFTSSPDLDPFDGLGNFDPVNNPPPIQIDLDRW